MAVKSYLLGGHGLLARLAELLDDLVVVSQILLAANENDGKALAEVQNLGDPLLGGGGGEGTCQRAVAWGVAGERLTFSCTLSRESGESTAKQIRMT